jgi:hypothetical protein
MSEPCNAAPLLCTRCHTTPRLPKQRWCRQCLTATQRARRAAQRGAQAADTSGSVTHAAPQAMPGGVQEPPPAAPALLRRRQPPRTAAEWHALGQLLSQYKQWNARIMGFLRNTCSCRAQHEHVHVKYQIM